MDGIRVDEFESMTRAELDALRVAVAEVALEHLPECRMIRDVAERACVLAHLAADALAVVDDNCVVLITGDGFDRTYLHAGRFLTLKAHHWNSYSGFFVFEHMDIGVLRIEFTVVAE